MQSDRPAESRRNGWHRQRYSPGPADDRAASAQRVAKAIAAAELDGIGLFSDENDPSLVFDGLTWAECQRAISRSRAAWLCFARWQFPFVNVTKAVGTAVPKRSLPARTPGRGAIAV